MISSDSHPARSRTGADRCLIPKPVDRDRSAVNRRGMRAGLVGRPRAGQRPHTKDRDQRALA